MALHWWVETVTRALRKQPRVVATTEETGGDMSDRTREAQPAPKAAR